MGFADIKWTLIDIAGGHAPPSVTIKASGGLQFHNSDANEDYLIEFFTDDDPDPGDDPRHPIVSAYVPRRGGNAYFVPDLMMDSDPECSYNVINAKNVDDSSKDRRTLGGGTHTIIIDSGLERGGK